MESINGCLIEITEDALLIANTGQPFSRAGIISICASHLGTKHDLKPIDTYQGVPETDLVNAIKEKELKTYKNDPNRIFEDFRGEDETMRDYGGRLIWELLQNADDAMSPEGTPPSNLIGSKGLGFKSVLEITDEPEIYSGQFHFRFSSKETQEILKQELNCETPPTLTFRIPHKIYSGKREERVEELLRSYTTVIRLPLNNNAKDKIIKWLEKLDYRFLLLCQYIEHVRIILPENKSIEWKIKRGCPGELRDADFLIESRVEGQLTTVYYRRWAETWASAKGKRHSVALSLAIDEDKQIKPLEDAPPFHVFFKTEESMPYHALIHASFDLEQNRKHVRKEDLDEDVLNHFERLIERVTDEIPPKVILQTLVPVKEIGNSNRLANALMERIDRVLKKKRFIPCIGGEVSTPEKAQLWDYDLGNVVNPEVEEIRQECLIVPDIVSDKQCSGALKYLGCKEVQWELYPNLLLYCINLSRQDCEKTAKTLFSITEKNADHTRHQPEVRKKFLSGCHSAPCWWIDKKVARALSTDKPLLKKKPDEELPSWLNVDTLDNDFRDTFENTFKNYSKSESRDELLEGVLLEPNDDNLIHVVLVKELYKHTEESWWEQNGAEVLNFYIGHMKDREFDKLSPIIWIDRIDKKRVRLSRALRLPTNKGWMPAWRCYAGHDWDGLLNEDILADIRDRGILLCPDKWPVDGLKDKIREWKGPLRYAGVSWEPKVLCFYDDKNPLPFQDSPSTPWEKYPPNPWGSKRKWDYWDDYCGYLKPTTYYNDSLFRCNAKLVKQWAIEFFPEILPESAKDKIEIMRPLIKEVLNNKQIMMLFKYDKRGDEVDDHSMDSLAKYQCLNVEWIPCKDSLLHRNKFVTPEKSYLPGKGLDGLLPEVDISVPEGQEGRDLLTFLKQDLKVKEEIPSDKTWCDWLTKFPDAIKLTDMEVPVKTVRTVYKMFFQKFGQSPHWINEIETLPCFVWNKEIKKEEIAFLNKDKVHWLDEPSFDDPNTRKELVKKFNIFIFALDEGEKACEWLGIHRLSESVGVKPDCDEIDTEKGNSIFERYKDRYKALQSVVRSKLPEPDKLILQAVKGLYLKIIVDNQEVAKPFIPEWKDDERIMVDTNNAWYGMGLVLAKLINEKKSASLFESILRANDMKEVLQRLRDNGVPEYSLVDIEASIHKHVEEPIIESVEDISTVEPPHDSSITAETKVIKYIPEFHPDISSIERLGREEGIEAQEWLRGKLKDLLKPSGWNISNEPVKEADVFLKHPEHGEYYIEVKRVGSGLIYWSENQVKNAKGNMGHYFLVILNPEAGGTDDYKVTWLWNPLEDLQKMEKTGNWKWGVKEDTVKINSKNWQVPEPRCVKEADQFSFRIRIDNDFLDKHPHGLEMLIRKLECNRRNA